MSLAGGIAGRFANLPVSAALDELKAGLKVRANAVLSAPPGAGKTTLVPLVLLGEPWCAGRIILIEPRRLAARAAARRMAAMLGEQISQTVGYRMRLDTQVSDQTRIEVVTEGVFTRMALDDPGLTGIDCVIFDEFHERALEADFGLALALDIQSGLREDLRILVMSATLDTERVIALLQPATEIRSEGRSYPVEIRYMDGPAGERIESEMARAIVELHGSEGGSILAFLPGQGEINRVAERLGTRLGDTTLIMPLYGALAGEEQDEAIRPAPAGRRKVVLATPVAETSITIDGVRIVIDSGLVRQPVYEPSTGITRLETIRASRASVDQRAGRAGRTEPGVAIRLWHSGQTAALSPFSQPQILASDLSGLVLDCAAFGVRDPASLRFMDPPGRVAVAEARELLTELGALDKAGAITPKGKAMRELALPPRLASMVIGAERDETGEAAEIAVLLTEQGLGGTMVDLDSRLLNFRRDRSPRASAARRLARNLARKAGGREPGNAAQPVAGHLAVAFPDRIAMQRGGRGRYVMANGRGCLIDESEQLSGARYLVVADLSGKAAGARVLAAAELAGEALDRILRSRSRTQDECFFDPASLSVRARRVTRLDSIVLSEAPISRPAPEALAEALTQGVRETGLATLPFSPSSLQLRDRVAFLRGKMGESWPDLGEGALLARLDSWFTPFQTNISSLKAIDPSSLHRGLEHLIGHERLRELDRLAPTHYLAPTGSRVPIRYDEGEPVLSIRVQELFGETRHPCIAGGQTPLLLELLSPARRPLQTTRDLPGFWSGSWAAVRADMRGRYPRHPWPEDPSAAQPTSRAKSRKS